MSTKKHCRPDQPTRREFLKQAIGGIAGLALFPKDLPAFFSTSKSNLTNSSKGRVLKGSVMLFSEPKFSARPVGRVGMNSVVGLLESMQGESDPFGDSDWYRISSHLFVHASDKPLVE